MNGGGCRSHAGQGGVFRSPRERPRPLTVLYAPGGPGATLGGVAEPDHLDQRLERAIISLLERRADTASICPSDAARAAYEGDDDGWRALMEPVRRAAWRLVEAGEVEVTQAGRPVAKTGARGPLRIRRVRR
ncbi:hypothetical protein GCM10010335_66170 [Streptomyces galbus]|uniref:DUF3253 domain-containing protein n=1 Tax=Streptomyces galbus TaxID=33898 RepID=A0A4U5WUF6_STRGB|nr:DUF3253 domain-containing protein [Streptomyces galbus]GHD53081.1 hypothetical protein GCM10010335_66170 [Streptomyces galbus]